LETVLSIQPRSSSAGGKTREQVIAEIAINIQGKVPPLYELDAVAEKFPTDYNESMNTVLT
jgi:dynein heavy chain